LAVETKISNDGKKNLLAFLIWLALGMLGGHRFYLNKSGAILQGFFCFGSFMSTEIFKNSHYEIVAQLMLALTTSWILIDVCFIFEWVKVCNNKLREEIMNNFSADADSAANRSPQTVK
jgi:hypothetical protein